MSKQVDFNPLREWMMANGAVGTMMVPADAEDYWELYRDEDPTLPEWDLVADIVLGTWDWRRGIADLMSERAYEAFDTMFNDVIAGIKRSPEYPA